MEQNLAVISKKVWDIVKVAMFMIKKGLCKKKIFMDLNMMMKRGKIARKALKNLMFHNHQFHHHHHHNKVHNNNDNTTKGGGVGGPASNLPNDAPQEQYSTKKSNKNIYHHKNSTQFYTPLPYFLEDGENKVDLEEVNKMMEMILRDEEATTDATTTVTAVSAPSPIVPRRRLGCKRSPVVRQLRITDSPFPVQNTDDNKYVDQAAGDFIERFYSKLNKQNYC